MKRIFKWTKRLNPNRFQTKAAILQVHGKRDRSRIVQKQGQIKGIREKIVRIIVRPQSLNPNSYSQFRLQSVNKEQLFARSHKRPDGVV